MNLVTSVLILQSLFTKGIGEAFIRNMLKNIKHSKFDIDKTICSDARAIRELLNIEPCIATHLANNYTNALSFYHLLVEKNIELIWQGDEFYPPKITNVLDNAAPPFLFLKGNKKLLTQMSVGFCGARNSSERGLEIASKCVEILTKNQICIVSGYAKGVDMTAHKTALQNGGNTIFVLAEGIMNFTEKREIQSLLSNENALVVSQFAPNVRWFSQNAMKRNHLIVGLTDAMVVIESKTDGGSFAAGNATLEHNQPLFVVDYAQAPQSASGNKFLIKKGGKPLQQTKEHTPNLRELVKQARVKFAKNNSTKYTIQDECLPLYA